MSSYQIELVEDSLARYQQRISAQEAGASAFKDNRVESSDGQWVNRACFDTLPPGRVPAPPAFVPIDAVPAGKTVLWQGVVLVQNLNLAVAMFRQEASS